MENFSKGERIKIRKNDFKSKIKLFSLIKNENGFILFENLISLSIILMLLSGIGSVIYWTMQKGKEIRGDFELTREIVYVMERITEDVNLADKVKLDHSSMGEGIFIEYRTKANDDVIKVSYVKMDAPRGSYARVIVNDPNAPMTGDSELGKVNITSFKTKKISPHLMTVELEGTSMVTNHTYKLETSIYTQGEITE